MSTPPAPSPSTPSSSTPPPGLPPGLPVGLPACALIDLDAVRSNAATLVEHAGDAAVMAVVKADGYGHGLLPVARAALDGGATWLGVAQLAEALQVRAAGITAPLLSWLTVPGDAFAEALVAGIDIGVSAPWALAEVATAARRTGRTARVHLKLDTGLSRNGLPLRQWPDVVDTVLKLAAEGLVELVGAMSHYAWADAPEHPTVRAQTAAFTEAVEYAQSCGARFAVRHLANSAATLTDPRTHFDLVRPGLALYGLSPVPDLATSDQLGLRPAMTLLGRVALVKQVPVGSGVSYGYAYTTTCDTTLALVPLGYADGVPRHAGNTGPVQLRGRRYQVAGRVCMDQFVVDLADPGNADGVVEGDEVVLFGPADRGPTAQEWADAAGTISYEIVTRLGTRVPRRYVGGRP